MNTASESAPDLGAHWGEARKIEAVESAKGSRTHPYTEARKFGIQMGLKAHTPPRAPERAAVRDGVPFDPAPRAGGGLLRPGGFSFKVAAAGDGPGEAGAGGRFSRTRGRLDWN